MGTNGTNILFLIISTFPLFVLSCVRFLTLPLLLFFKEKIFTRIWLLLSFLIQFILVSFYSSNLIYHIYFDTWLDYQTIYYLFIKDIYWVLPMLIKLHPFMLLSGIVIVLIFSIILLKGNIQYEQYIKHRNNKLLINFIKFGMYILLSLFFVKIFHLIEHEKMLSAIKQHPIFVLKNSIRRYLLTQKQNSKNSELYVKYNYLKKLNSLNSNKFEKKNVILIISETLRNDYIFENGELKHKILKKASLRGGVLVKNMFSQSSETVTSISSIFSSILPFKINQINNHVLLHEIFKNLGYCTGAFSGYTLEWRSMNDIFSKNFDEVYYKKFDSVDNDKNALKKLFKWIDLTKNKHFFAMVGLYAPHFGYREKFFKSTLSSNNILDCQKDIYMIAVTLSVVGVMKNI